MPVVSIRNHAMGDTSDVIPQRLPLAFLIPDVGTLEQGHQQPLGLHEDQLGRTDERFHSGILRVRGGPQAS